MTTTRMVMAMGDRQRDICRAKQIQDTRTARAAAMAAIIAVNRSDAAVCSGNV